MASLFKLRGEWSTHPLTGPFSGDPSLSACLDETTSLSSQENGVYDLQVDTPVPVSFGGVTGATVLIVKAVGGEVNVTITTASGTSVIPVDGFLALLDASVPITAVTLTRPVGVEVIVKVFLGQH